MFKPTGPKFASRLLLAAAPLSMGAVYMSAAPAAVQAQDTKAPIFIQKWTGPYGGVPPWDQVKVAEFPNAFTVAMAEARADFEKMLANPAPVTFDNTIVQMELSGDKMSRAFSIFGVHQGNLSTPELRKIETEWLPKISSFYNTMALDARYFQRIKFLYDSRDTLGLDAVQMRLLDKTYKDMVRGGAMLNKDDKAKVIAIETELATKFSEFSAKVLADEESYIVFTDAADVAGLSDSFLASLRQAAKSQGKEGWAAQNTRSVMQPFLENATNRNARQKVYEAYINRGDNGGKNDTNQVIADILKLRADRAAILGFDSHAEYRMANTMAGTPARAMELMMQVWPAAVARVKEEVADMQAIADGEAAGITIEPWDYRYYAEKVRKDKYDLDAAQIKPYFQLDNMVDALHDTANRLYGLEFTENTGTVPVFDPEVRTFEISRDGKVLGIHYLDNFARPGKRSGAWMTTYKDRYKLGGENSYIITANNNNFVQGGDGEATLISLDDATTLFHEFGHALHYINMEITYPSLGTTPRDFVEYPSQVNENWLMTPYILQKYARHHKTGEPIPAELLAKIEASSKFNEGFATVEYLASAIVDMKLHDRATPITDVDAFERKALQDIGMPSEIVMRHRLPQFNHLFASDAYSAGYYSYLWSETMDADTWAAFEEAGSVWDRKTAKSFQKLLLATGNETDRLDAYRAFRGRDPDVRYIMKKRGFPVPGEK